MQRHKKWLHIIVDGGSTDGTLSYLKKLPKENTLFISEPDNGIYDAMNKGWKLAEDDSFVFYLNARDEMTDPLSLSHANKALQSNPASKWGCTTHEEAFEDGSGWVCKLVSPPSVPNQLYAFGYRSHQAVIMKKAFIENLGGFHEQYKIAADWDLIARAINAQPPTIWIEPIAKFELGGMSSNRILEAHMELRMLRYKYLVNKLTSHIYDTIWCAIYLDYFGYRNSFSLILEILKWKVRLKEKIIHSIPKNRNVAKRTRIPKDPILEMRLRQLLKIQPYVSTSK
jgi:glycosyltransferase